MREGKEKRNVEPGLDRRINFKLNDDMHWRLKLQATRRRMTLQELLMRYAEAGLLEDEGGEKEGRPS